MKKSALLLLFLAVFILSGVFISVFLPKININITIEPQYQSAVHAHESEQEKPHCSALYNHLVMKDLIKVINEYYEKGYSLKGFSSSSYGQFGMTQYSAVVCKENFPQTIDRQSKQIGTHKFD